MDTATVFKSECLVKAWYLCSLILPLWPLDLESGSTSVLKGGDGQVSGVSPGLKLCCGIV